MSENGGKCKHARIMFLQNNSVSRRGREHQIYFNIFGFTAFRHKLSIWQIEYCFSLLVQRRRGFPRSPSNDRAVCQRCVQYPYLDAIYKSVFMRQSCDPAFVLEMWFEISKNVHEISLVICRRKIYMNAWRISFFFYQRTLICFLYFLKVLLTR